MFSIKPSMLNSLLVSLPLTCASGYFAYYALFSIKHYLYNASAYLDWFSLLPGLMILISISGGLIWLAVLSGATQSVVLIPEKKLIIRLHSYLIFRKTGLPISYEEVDKVICYRKRVTIHNTPSSNQVARHSRVYYFVGLMLSGSKPYQLVKTYSKHEAKKLGKDICTHSGIPLNDRL
ncbi:hypothetical protein [Marinicella sp. W31]|uniref:hypothetical protein n=1 Tax=Marinicella sp. W31 TaxID=3023713 RepID=UPI00375716D2